MTEKRAYQCLVCGETWYLHLEPTPDTPGNRYPADWQPLRLPCGHDDGPRYDAEHTWPSWWIDGDTHGSPGRWLPARYPNPYPASLPI